LISFIALWALYGLAVLRLGPRWKFVRYLPFVIAGLVVTAPFWSLAVMMLMRSSCTVNEGGPHPCLLLGLDIGGLLYGIGNMTAWGFFFLPILALAASVYVAIHLPFFIAAIRRDKARSPPEPKPRLVAAAAMLVIAIVAAEAR
jgi:hypothetical protein